MIVLMSSSSIAFGFKRLTADTRFSGTFIMFPSLTVFFYEVYISLRREPKRELRFTIPVCEGKITERNYVHSDQYIGAVRNDTLNDTNTLTLKPIG